MTSAFVAQNDQTVYNRLFIQQTLLIMPIKHLLLAFLVAIIWGVNFLFVKLGLEEISPLLLCALRFLLASVPAVFFIKPPAVPFRLVVLYGFFMFAFQFGFLFLGMHIGMTPGMASLLMQVQVFFSIFFAAVLLNESPNSWQMLGALVAFSGMGIVAMHLDQTITVWGFLLVLIAAASWGYGNLVTKKMKKTNMMAVVVWGSFVAFVPMLMFSFLFEGLGAMADSYHRLTWVGATSVFYIVYISTWVGYVIWNGLLSRYPVGTIVPFSLLVPVVGILSSVIFLGESFQLWKLAAGLLVMTGLCINLLSTRYFALKLQKEAVNG